MKQYEQIQAPEKWLKKGDSCRKFRKMQVLLDLWDTSCVKSCGSLSPLLPVVGRTCLTGVEGKVAVAVDPQGEDVSQLCSFRFHSLSVAILSTQDIRKAWPAVIRNEY